ncbi:MAG: hypothetical protein A2Z64_15170 [Betaproteobacteria bacterium RIFCSPLOWO2_02_67_12]|nr:MAG: hypothetical protein A2Z64_15170 [Betaproteobacteria bacterium RIFCSPLOWO2_02_67_12]
MRIGVQIGARLVVLLLLAACGTGGHATKDDPQFARSLADTATVAAVAKRGVRVCREMQVGIAERDWVRGVVVEAEGSRVAVRIDEPGRFEHSVHGVKVTRGAIVSDDAVAWTPCL